jgi:hypothetical protein
MKMLVKTCRLVHSDQPVLGIADASGIAGQKRAWCLLSSSSALAG